MSTDSDPSGEAEKRSFFPQIRPQPAVVLWCIANGIETTNRLPDVTMFSERECHGHILTLADKGLVTYARSHWWQTRYDGETFYRRHKRARLTEDGRAELRMLEAADWLSETVLDRYVIGDPAELEA